MIKRLSDIRQFRSRRGAAGLVVVWLGIALSGCADPDVVSYQLHYNMQERAAAGAVLGAGLGAALGSAVAINPAAGALIGSASGALAGAVAGAITTEPAPSYGPIPVRDVTAVPAFYDTWPPGYSVPPLGTETPPPPPWAG